MAASSRRSLQPYLPDETLPKRILDVEHGARRGVGGTAGCTVLPSGGRRRSAAGDVGRHRHGHGRVGGGTSAMGTATGVLSTTTALRRLEFIELDDLRLDLRFLLADLTSCFSARHSRRSRRLGCRGRSRSRPRPPSGLDVSLQAGDLGVELELAASLPTLLAPLCRVFIQDDMVGSLGSLGSLGWGGTLRELDGGGPWHSCCCAVDQVGLLPNTVRGRADYARFRPRCRRGFQAWRVLGYSRPRRKASTNRSRDESRRVPDYTS